MYKVTSNSTKDNLLLFLSFLGMCVVSKYAILTCKWIKKYFYRPKRDFFSEYGNGWVLITGSSKGLGKSFAKQFAKNNMNIILTARSENELKKTASEIQKINPKGKIEYIVCDYNENLMKNNFLSRLDNYEINILINNVGAFSFNYLEKLADDDILRMININIIASTFITKYVIEKMKKRKNKSLIVTVGSDLILYNPPFTQVYNGSKSYLKSLMFSISQENKNIDCTYLEPGPVNTSLNTKKIQYKVDPDDYAKKSMPQLGRYLHTHGHYLHAFKYILYGNYLVYNLHTKKDLKKEFEPNKN